MWRTQEMLQLAQIPKARHVLVMLHRRHNKVMPVFIQSNHSDNFLIFNDGGGSTLHNDFYFHLRFSRS